MSYQMLGIGYAAGSPVSDVTFMQACRFECNCGKDFTCMGLCETVCTQKLEEYNAAAAAEPAPTKKAAVVPGGGASNSGGGGGGAALPPEESSSLPWIVGGAVALVAAWALWRK